jgi:hypothetical protein
MSQKKSDVDEYRIKPNEDHRNGTCRIGSIVARRVPSFRKASETTLRNAAAEEDSKELTIFFAGTNVEAALASIRYNFRIVYPLLFLSSQPMGDWRNYLFYSLGMM